MMIFKCREYISSDCTFSILFALFPTDGCQGVCKLQKYDTLGCGVVIQTIPLLENIIFALLSKNCTDLSIKIRRWRVK